MKRYWSLVIGHWSLKKGFTLMELLVVIAIMAILVSLGTVAYSSAQKQSRDSKRKADLKAVQNAFEQYYADNKAYPAACNTIATDTTYFPGGFPKDPKSGAYYYTPGTIGAITIGNTCSALSYYFGVSLEGSLNSGTAFDSTCSTLGSGPYYCVKNLQ